MDRSCGKQADLADILGQLTLGADVFRRLLAAHRRYNGGPDANSVPRSLAPSTSQLPRPSGGQRPSYGTGTSGKHAFQRCERPHASETRSMTYVLSPRAGRSAILGHDLDRADDMRIELVQVLGWDPRPVGLRTDRGTPFGPRTW